MYSLEGQQNQSVGLLLDISGLSFHIPFFGSAVLEQVQRSWSDLTGFNLCCKAINSFLFNIGTTLVGYKKLEFIVIRRIPQY
jgi:hypothetical protein